MSLTYELSMSPRLGCEVAPATVAFAQLLVVPFAEMDALIDEELSANDALERIDDGECPICAGRWPSRCPVCARPARAVDDGQRAVIGAPEAADVETDCAALSHAVRLDDPGLDPSLVEYVVDSLDRHGILDRSCAELAAHLGVAEQSVADVVAAIRRVGPPGVGASSIGESLLFQLQALDVDDDLIALAADVLVDHLPALAHGHLASIAAELDVPTCAVRDLLDLVRHRLRPYPAFDGNHTPVTPYVVPDLVVHPDDEVDGAFRVELVEPSMIRLAIRPAAAGGDLAPSLTRARSFLGQLHDRWDTLRRIAELVVDHQREFVRRGPAARRPLTRAAVAAELGLHESTVSRAVADKYAVLPDRSIVALADFFGADAGIEGELRRLLDAADGPISDQRLADELCAAGYRVARRTVAKHRARLGIASTLLR